MWIIATRRWQAAVIHREALTGTCANGATGIEYQKKWRFRAFKEGLPTFA